MAAAATSELYSTYLTFLMAKTGSPAAYTQLGDIKNYPDIGSASDMIDMSTLSNASKIGIPGIKNQDAMQFTFNYNPTVYQTIKAYDDNKGHDFAVYFGATVTTSAVTPTGDDGKFEFKGMLSGPVISGKGVNEGREMTVTITPTTDIAFSAAT